MWRGLEELATLGGTADPGQLLGADAARALAAAQLLGRKVPHQPARRGDAGLVLRGDLGRAFQHQEGLAGDAIRHLRMLRTGGAGCRCAGRQPREQYRGDADSHHSGSIFAETRQAGFRSLTARMVLTINALARYARSGINATRSGSGGSALKDIEREGAVVSGHVK